MIDVFEYAFNTTKATFVKKYAIGGPSEVTMNNCLSYPYPFGTIQPAWRGFHMGIAVSRGELR